VASLYDLLGVPPDASVDEIHHAYRERARALHPDAAGDSADNEEAMRELNEAWAILRDPDRRAAYDDTLDPFDFPEWNPYHRPPSWVRRAPVIAVLAVLLAIFILTAYAAVPTTGR